MHSLHLHKKSSYKTGKETKFIYFKNTYPFFFIGTESYMGDNVFRLFAGRVAVAMFQDACNLVMKDTVCLQYEDTTQRLTTRMGIP